MKMAPRTWYHGRATALVSSERRFAHPWHHAKAASRLRAGLFWFLYLLPKVLADCRQSDSVIPLKPESSLFNMFWIQAFAGVTGVGQVITFGNGYITCLKSSRYYGRFLATEKTERPSGRGSPFLIRVFSNESIFVRAALSG